MPPIAQAVTLRILLFVSSFHALLLAEWLTFTLDLRDAADAHVVFEAVRLNLLPLIKRRLTTEEREQLSSGNVFVWRKLNIKAALNVGPTVVAGKVLS